MSEPRPPAAPSSASTDPGWRLENSYASLPPVFHFSIAPVPVRAPRLVLLNRALAESLGLAADALEGENGAAIFAGNVLPPGASPLAQAYAGHQYGGFTTLGDGRAILLGEQITPQGERFDIQLKGSGRTPFSRGGDGRAALGPMLREYIISEAMHALGIPTTRSLAVAATGEMVMRQDGPLPGAVLTRVADSHIRVGTFEWAAAAGERADLEALVAYTLQRHFPELAAADNPALALLEAVIGRQAALIARWMGVGFIHGVMNTDNMALSGETIDYGPCAFMDAYDPATVFSSIDRHGRYAYANQPTIAQWNLARLGETLLPMIHPEETRAIELATEAIRNFTNLYQSHWLAEMRCKLGLFNEEEGDVTLVHSLFEGMHGAKADFTNTFARLSQPAPDESFRQWQETWQARLVRQPQSLEESAQLRRAHNPAFIPRNHLVEAALAAGQHGDTGPLDRLLEILAAPYDHARDVPEYRSPDPTDGAGYRTFCGT
ncbi:MAG: YdiU family protein [Verrucomicrobiota bacterium]